MSAPFVLPIVARSSEVELIAQVRDNATRGQGGVILRSGDGGVGKTRLVSESATPARSAGWRVAIGRAYAVETAIPYAPFADALQPVLEELDPHVLTRITRGDRSALTAVAPSLAGNSPTEHSGSGLSGAEQRLRLHSTIVHLIGKLAERQPLFLAIENLHWADASSVELFHFLARQASTMRLVLIGTWNETERDMPPALGLMVRSLRSLGACNELQLQPLSKRSVRELVGRAFETEESLIDDFASRLFEVTRGNPLFIEQTLLDLVQRGELWKSGPVWLGWQLDTFVLPRSVRDVLRARTDRLRDSSRQVAEWIAVTGTEVEHDMLLVVAGLGEPELLDALDELRAGGMITERVDGSVLYHDLSHPLLRQALIDIVGIARQRSMHANIANAMETIAGPRAEQRAEQLAALWRGADPNVDPARAFRWLTLAAERAVERTAHREAAMLYRATLERADAHPDAVSDEQRRQFVDALSRLYRRIGESQKAFAMAERARDDALARKDDVGVATAERRMGLAAESLGRRRDALEHFNLGIAAAQRARDDLLLVRIRLAKGNLLQALGQPEDAKREVASALETAERLDRVSLLARVHRLLLMLHLWSGPAHRAWAHARSAVALAEQSGERNVAWSAHWAAAVLAGMTSNAPALHRHLEAATRLAEELSSPLLQLRMAEVGIEYRASIGDWDRALLEGERTIAATRALEQNPMLARNVLWVGGVYLHRGDTATARRMFDEAWEVSGAATLDLAQPFAVHGVLPAHVARVMYLVAVGEHARALELGRVAVDIADRTGNIAWAVYRLLPTLAEAALALGDEGAVEEVRRRLAQDASWLAHPIGQAWVSVIDAEVAMRSDRSGDAIPLLQHAVATLEGVPFPHDAALIRLRLAKSLHKDGQDGEAAREARAALETFE